MFDASLHVRDARRRTPITNATIRGPSSTPMDVKQSSPGLYELALSAPGDFKVCAPDYLCNETYIYEEDAYTIELDTVYSP
jgi:hypothetical protein